MNQTLPPGMDDTDKTRPPTGALRYETPQDLYAALPQLAELTQHRPREGEDALAYMSRLRSSTTPEEAVTYTSFAALPQMAIWWGHECLRCMPEALDKRDRALMEMIAAWVASPTQDYRHQIMREALWAPARSPAVMLGLAVGWSGAALRLMILPLSHLSGHHVPSTQPFLAGWRGQKCRVARSSWHGLSTWRNRCTAYIDTRLRTD